MINGLISEVLHWIGQRTREYFFHVLYTERCDYVINLRGFTLAGPEDLHSCFFIYTEP